MRACLLVLTVFALACSSPMATETGDLHPAPAPDEGFRMEMRTMAAPAEEIWKCQVGPLPTELTGFLDVHRVTSRQSEGMHHMDIMTTALAGVTLPSGTFDCRD